MTADTGKAGPAESGADIDDRSASEISLRHDAFGRLVIRLPDGSDVAGVVPVRCFPFAAPGEWVAFCDDGGRVIHNLPRIDMLSPAQRELLDRELAEREFVPVIERILGAGPDGMPAEWLVRTDRGDTRISLPSEDNIRALGAHGVLVTDAHGIRFLIPDRRKLDARSRRVIARYL